MTCTVPRANRHGSPCPDWCAADHSRSFSRGLDTTIDGHWNTTDTVTVAGAPVHEGGYALAFAYNPASPALGSEVRIIIDAHADRNGPVDTWLEPTSGQACGIAGLVEALAHASPEQHPQLRTAASIVTSGGTGGAS